MSRRPIVAGNWKLHKNAGETRETIRELASNVDAAGGTSAEIVVCPPFTSLSAAVEAARGSDILIGAQNVSSESSGAFTGEVASEMLEDLGVSYVIIGHSERRWVFGETDDMVNAKLRKVLDGDLVPIVCVGERLEDREGGRTEEVVRTQVTSALKGISEDAAVRVVIAYEPVWAIGTGRTATPEQADEVHRLIRDLIRANFGGCVADGVRILYGGSVKPGNAGEILSQNDVDGVLVGGASLEAVSFARIIEKA
ncbi:MAG: triose-phosphate isomerase [Candidatus Eisenbacteria bacterium]|nr:triose-phosphate isomerase [Candidatus Eisenbacteria bacterium]